MWTRQSVNNLNNGNLPGPPGDYLNDQATMFLYAGDKHAGENSTGNAVMTVLKSPEFLVEEHPIECFSFWFYFGVSTQKLVKEKIMQNTILIMNQFLFIFMTGFFLSYQTEGNAETLKVFIENKDGKIQQDLWKLNDDIPNDEKQWIEGRVEIKGSELSNDDAYRVCNSLNKPSIVF